MAQRLGKNKRILKNVISELEEIWEDTESRKQKIVCHQKRTDLKIHFVPKNKQILKVSCNIILNSPNWKQPKGPSTNESINKMWCRRTVQLSIQYSVVFRHEKEWSADRCYTAAEPWEEHIEWRSRSQRTI